MQRKSTVHISTNTKFNSPSPLRSMKNFSLWTWFSPELHLPGDWGCWNRAEKLVSSSVVSSFRFGNFNFWLKCIISIFEEVEPLRSFFALNLHQRKKINGISLTTKPLWYKKAIPVFSFHQIPLQWCFSACCRICGSSSSISTRKVWHHLIDY